MASSQEALLVIDVQVGLMTGAFEEKRVMKAIQTAISKIRSRSGSIIFIQHCHQGYKPLMKGNEGWQLCPSLNAQDQDLYIEKEASDAFYETNLFQILEDRNIDRVYVCGLQTEYCVDTTCRSALSKRFNVSLISDAHTTGDSDMPAAKIIDHHNTMLQSLAHPHFCIDVIPSEAI